MVIANKLKKRSVYQIRKVNTVNGMNERCDKRLKVCSILEVSLRIWNLIPKTAFGVDFFILLGPNLKIVFIYVGNAFY